MTKAKGIVKNMGFLFISQLITYVIGFFITMYTARYLGTEGFGILSLALSITVIFGVIVDMGLGTLMIREIARDRIFRDKYVSNVSLIKFFLSFLMMGLLILTTNIIGYPPIVKNVIYLIALSVIIYAFVVVLTSVFQAYEKMSYVSAGAVVNSLVMLVGTAIGIYYSLDLLYFANIYVISNLLLLVFTITLYVWKFSLPKLSIKGNFWKPTIKEALPYGIAGIFVTIYYSIDSVMLSIMIGNEVVGIYNAAYKFVFLFLSLYSVYTVAVFPVMSSFYKNSRESLKFAYERSFKYLLILSIPLSIGVTLFANQIILLIYGSDYFASVIALQILIWTIIFLFLNGLSGILLGSSNKQIIVTKITGLSVLLNVALNLVLIPNFSYVGASIATVFTEFASVPIFIYVVCKIENIDLKEFIKNTSKIIFSGIIMISLVLILNKLNPYFLLLIVCIAYSLSLYLTKTFDEEDYMLIKNLIKN
ncbi:flippase [uncultured Methanobacterium sp.]|uniref:flippase n=1 Tax=uncultured Methanobacterium sp. TaxID=176306 RepID=UPI002AA72F6C|nr:flippase [uncultured Methanobacterium sp.]